MRRPPGWLQPHSTDRTPARSAEPRQWSAANGLMVWVLAGSPPPRPRSSTAQHVARFLGNEVALQSRTPGCLPTRPRECPCVRAPVLACRPVPMRLAVHRAHHHRRHTHPRSLSVLLSQSAPRQRLEARLKPFRAQPTHWTRMGGAMDTRIDPLTPRVCLAVEIVEISERDSCPEALLHHTDRSLDFALRLWYIRLADAWCDGDRGHKIGKAGIPARLVVFHL